MQVAPAEIEDGCIEYKRNFMNINNSKLNHLTAQMNWRINEGNGICNYYLGVCDNGSLYELFTQEEIDYSLDILKMMVEGCNAYIDNIIINRVKDNIWLNIKINRNYAFITEYRILCDNTNINKLLVDYKKSKDIYFNSLVHNNEKYLFFECSKKIRANIENIIYFNLIINKKFVDLESLMNYVEYNMSGNNVNDTDDVIFNIIKSNYIQSIGYILFGYLKQGKITNGMELEYKNNKIQILSIHNNYIDCTEASAPATISLRVLINNNINNINNLDGVLFYKSRKLLGEDHQLQGLDLDVHKEIRRDNRRRRQEQHQDRDQMV
jgi:GTPase